MIYFLLFFLTILGVFGYVREKKWLNLQTMFCIVWAAISWAASLKLYGMRDYSDDMYLLVFLGAVGFAIGYSFLKTPNFQFQFENFENPKYVINQKVFNVLYYIATIFILYFAFKVAMLLRSGVPYYSIRLLFGRMSVEGALLTNKYELFIQVFVLNAIVPIYLLFLVMHILKIYKLTKIQIVKILVLVAAYTFVSGSRITMINAMFQTVMVFFMMKIKIDAKYLKKLVCVVALLMFIVSWISEGRTNVDAKNYVSKEQTYYQDFTLALPMGDYYKEYCDRGEGERAYGAMFTSGFINLLMRPLGLFGIPRPGFMAICDKYNSMIDEFIVIYRGGSVNNAYASMFFYFYLDFGYAGVFALSGIFGFMMKFLYVNCIKRQDLRAIMLFAAILIAFTKMFVRWEFVNTHYCLSFVYIYWLTKKNYRYVLKR